jgi:hypothetical protein
MATIKELEEKNRQLQEELDRMKTAKAAGVNAPMILPDPSITPTIPYQETETKKIRLFRDEYRYKAPLFVSINGRNWLINRGVEVEVPKYVADFIEQQMTEEAAIWKRVAEEEEEYRKQTAKLG